MTDWVPWAMLGPPRDLDDYHERERTFWMAFAIDRQSCSATDWCLSLDESELSGRRLKVIRTDARSLTKRQSRPRCLAEDITTHLPLHAGTKLAAVAVFGDETALRVDPHTAQIPALSIHNEHVFEGTTAPIGTMGLYIKACVLLGRVAVFLQRE